MKVFKRYEQGREQSDRWRMGQTNERLNRNYGQRELMQQQGQTGKDTVKRIPPLLIFCSPTIS